MSLVYEMRLVAYTPNGARLGILPDAVTFDFTTTLNDMPTLALTYTLLGRHAEWLQVPCEIAVEWHSTNGWTEFDNGRFLNLVDDGDALDPTGAVTYTLSGYAFNLQKASITMTPAQRNKTDGKRNFNTQTVGHIINTLVVEAVTRGVLPALDYSTWTWTTDSSGELWRHDAVGLSFDVGTNLFVVLKQMSDSGLCDWNMTGRTLNIFNPNGTLGALRASARRVITTDSVNVQGFIDSVSGSVTSDVPSSTRPGTREAARHGVNGLHIAAHGEAPYPDDAGYELTTGVDTLSTTPANRQVGLWKMGTVSPDGVARALGALMCCYSNPSRWFFGVPVPDLTNRPDMIAANAWNRFGSGHVLLSESDDSVRPDQTSLSGYSAIGVQLIAKGMMCVEIVTYDSSEYSVNPVIIQGAYGWDNGLRSAMHVRINAAGHGLSARSDVGATTIPRSALPNVLLPQASHLGAYCRGRKIPYVRIGINSSVAANGALVGFLAQAMVAALTDMGSKQSLKFVASKAATDPDDPTQLGPVDLRFGRDLTEAPSTGDISQLAGRIYNYGDSWAQVVMENLDAPDPWGVWETVLASGGVNDTDTLEAQAQAAVDKGAAKRQTYVRGVSYINARWLPGRDYDTGDYVYAPGQDGQLIPMRIQTQTITKNAEGLAGSITMADRFLPFQTQISKAVLAASGGSVGGSSTAGAGVRTVNSIADTRRPLAPIGLVL